MSLMNIFQVSGSGLSAQSLRMNTIASNLSNAQSTASSVDDVYRARHPVFQAQEKSFSDVFSSVNSSFYESSQGVKVAGVVESQVPLPQRYEPGHPMADENGYVTYPNVNVVEEMADMISASRSYQLNATMLDAGRKMAERLLTVGRT